jgi:carboxy-cis,cis-muconate cyclase
VFAIDPESGVLSHNIQTFPYRPDSGIHGAALTPDNRFIYSADMLANAIFGHYVEQGTCLLKEAFRMDVEKPGSAPRHMVVNKNGKYLYVLMELTNELVVYDSQNGRKSPTFHQAFPLIPEGNVFH